MNAHNSISVSLLNARRHLLDDPAILVQLRGPWYNDWERPGRGSAHRGDRLCVQLCPRAKAVTSPTGTSAPYWPSRKISLGPQGQSVATIGTPTARASIKPVGNASDMDDMAEHLRLSPYKYTG